MTKQYSNYRVIPVRFQADDLKKLEEEAAALRLSIAALVRAKIAKLLEASNSAVQV